MDGAFFALVLDDASPAAASSAAPESTEVATDSSGGAVLVSGSSFFLEAREAVFFGLLAAAFRADLRAAGFFFAAAGSGGDSAPGAASSGASCAAAFFRTAFRLALAGAARLDFTASFGLADSLATGEAELSALLVVVLEADFFAGAFFAEVFLAVEAAFFALAAAPEALRFVVPARVFGLGGAVTEGSADSCRASGSAATSAADSVAGAWAFVRDFRAALGFFSPAVLGIAVLGVRHQLTRFKIRRIRITVRESTVWQRPLAADCDGT